jgi:hypothetical protein
MKSVRVQAVYDFADRLLRLANINYRGCASRTKSRFCGKTNLFRNVGNMDFGKLYLAVPSALESDDWTPVDFSCESRISDRPLPQYKSIYVAPPERSTNFLRTARVISTYFRRRLCFSFAQAPTSSSGKPSSSNIGNCSILLHERRVCSLFVLQHGKFEIKVFKDEIATFISGGCSGSVQSR